MPLYTNTSKGTVRYSSPTWETKLVENDITLGDTITETTGIINPFKIALGKYERVIGEAVLFYSSDNNNEFRFRWQNVDSADAYVDTMLKYSVVATNGEIANSGDALAANLEGGIGVDTSTGQGTIINIDSGSSASPLAATVKFSAIGNEDKNGTLSFQAANLSDQSGAAVLLAGSWINYKKF
jgi:hypothetical protein